MNECESVNHWGFLYMTQVLLVSATMPQEVMAVSESFMRNPVKILVKQEELTLEGIHQFYVQVEREVSTVIYVGLCFFSLLVLSDF